MDDARVEPLVIDSGVEIKRDMTRVDCYTIRVLPDGVISASVTATILSVLAEAVQHQKDDCKVLQALQDLVNQ